MSVRLLTQLAAVTVTVDTCGIEVEIRARVFKGYLMLRLVDITKII